MANEALTQLTTTLTEFRSAFAIVTSSQGERMAPDDLAEVGATILYQYREIVLPLVREIPRLEDLVYGDRMLAFLPGGDTDRMNGRYSDSYRRQDADRVLGRPASTDLLFLFGYGLDESVYFWNMRDRFKKKVKEAHRK